MNRLLVLLMLIGCGGNQSFISFPEPEPKKITPIVGSFGPSECFHNQQASDDIGYPIYTIINITFKEDHTGLNEVQLFDDIGCTNLLNDLDLPIKWVNIPNTDIYAVDQREGSGGHFLADIFVNQSGINIVQTDVNIDINLNRK